MQSFNKINIKYPFFKNVLKLTLHYNFIIKFMSLKNLLLLAFGCALFFTSCVSKKIFKGEQVRYVQLQAQYDKLQEDLKNLIKKG